MLLNLFKLKIIIDDQVVYFPIVNIDNILNDHCDETDTFAVVDTNILYTIRYVSKKIISLITIQYSQLCVNYGFNFSYITNIKYDLDYHINNLFKSYISRYGKRLIKDVDSIHKIKSDIIQEVFDYFHTTDINHILHILPAFFLTNGIQVIPGNTLLNSVLHHYAFSRNFRDLHQLLHTINQYTDGRPIIKDILRSAPSYTFDYNTVYEYHTKLINQIDTYFENTGIVPLMRSLGMVIEPPSSDSMTLRTGRRIFRRPKDIIAELFHNLGDYDKLIRYIKQYGIKCCIAGGFISRLMLNIEVGDDSDIDMWFYDSHENNTLGKRLIIQFIRETYGECFLFNYPSVISIVIPGYPRIIQLVELETIYGFNAVLYNFDYGYAQAAYDIIRDKIFVRECMIYTKITGWEYGYNDKVFRPHRLIKGLKMGISFMITSSFLRRYFDRSFSSNDIVEHFDSNYFNVAKLVEQPNPNDDVNDTMYRYRKLHKVDVYHTGDISAGIMDNIINTRGQTYTNQNYVASLKFSLNESTTHPMHISPIINTATIIYSKLHSEFDFDQYNPLQLSINYLRTRSYTDINGDHSLMLNVNNVMVVETYDNSDSGDGERETFLLSAINNNIKVSDIKQNSLFIIFPTLYMAKLDTVDDREPTNDRHPIVESLIDPISNDIITDPIILRLLDNNGDVIAISKKSLYSLITYIEPTRDEDTPDDKLIYLDDKLDYLHDNFMLNLNNIDENVENIVIYLTNIIFAKCSNIALVGTNFLEDEEDEEGEDRTTPRYKSAKLYTGMLNLKLILGREIYADRGDSDDEDDVERIEHFTIMYAYISRIINSFDVYVMLRISALSPDGEYTSYLEAFTTYDQLVTFDQHTIKRDGCNVIHYSPHNVIPRDKLKFQLPDFNDIIDDKFHLSITTLSDEIYQITPSGNNYSFEYICDEKNTRNHSQTMLLFTDAMPRKLISISIKFVLTPSNYCTIIFSAIDQSPTMIQYYNYLTIRLKMLRYFVPFDISVNSDAISVVVKDNMFVLWDDDRVLIKYNSDKSINIPSYITYSKNHKKFANIFSKKLFKLNQQHNVTLLV